MLVSRFPRGEKARAKRTVGTTAYPPLPLVLVAASAAPEAALPLLLESDLLSSLAAREPSTPPRTAPRMMTTAMMAPTTQGQMRRLRRGCFCEGAKEGQSRESGRRGRCSFRL